MEIADDSCIASIASESFFANDRTHLNIDDGGKVLLDESRKDLTAQRNETLRLPASTVFTDLTLQACLRNNPK